jgi:hypothetical protein
MLTAREAKEQASANRAHLLEGLRRDLNSSFESALVSAIIAGQFECDWKAPYSEVSKIALDELLIDLRRAEYFTSLGTRMRCDANKDYVMVHISWG